MLSMLFLPLMAGIIAYLAFKTLKFSCGKVLMQFNGLGFLLEETPALFAFGLFALECILFAASTCAFKQVSNHIILTLDIIYFLSLLMLILYHTFKDAGPHSSIA